MARPAHKETIKAKVLIKILESLTNLDREGKYKHELESFVLEYLASRDDKSVDRLVEISRQMG